MNPQPYILFGILNPVLFLFILSLWRFIKQPQREDAPLPFFFFFLYLSMAFSIFAETLPPQLDILIFANKICLCLAVFSLFMFLVGYFESLRKYRSFILVHMLFVAFIGLMYFPRLATVSVYGGSEEEMPCYNQHPGFTTVFLSYILFWSAVIIYFLYRSSLLTEKLSARVKLHLFILALSFTLLGILCFEVGLLDPRDIFMLEFTTKIYGTIFYIISTVLFVTSIFVPRAFLKFWEKKYVFSPIGVRRLTEPRNIAIIVGGILVNVGGGKITSSFHLPFFSDTIGTGIVAYTLGPWVAATAGLLTNVLLSVVAGVAYFPFAVCNITVGLLWGYLAKLGYARIVGAPAGIFWRKFLRFVLSHGVIVGIANAAIALLVSLAMFGGFSGHGAEYIAMATQKYIGSVAGNFLARAGIEIFDKTCAVLVAMFVSILVLQQESAEFLKYAKRKKEVYVDSWEVILFLLILVIFGLGTVPLFFLVLVLPPTAVVTPFTWVLLNFIWISAVSVIGLTVLYKWSR
ncbi:MAG: hypothetical protein QXJ27_02025 [Thermoplasmata archaeon]